MRQNAFKPIEEPRLARMIERTLKATGRLDPTCSLSLRTPPLAPDLYGTEPPGVAVTVFPTLFACEAKAAGAGEREIRRRRLVRWSELDPAGGRRRYALENGKKVDVTPIRFVAGCQKGHLQDIDWCRVVHGDASCREPMWLVETGTSADPRDTMVVCDGERSLSLEQAFQRGRLGRCHGERPWLGDRDPVGCDLFLRLLTRTATNTYFPQIAAVISLPRAEDVLAALVQGHFSDLDQAQNPADIAQARRFNSALRASLEGYSDEDVFARLQQLLSRHDQDSSLPPKLAEFDVFASGEPTIGENPCFLSSRNSCSMIHRARYQSTICQAAAALVVSSRHVIGSLPSGGSGSVNSIKLSVTCAGSDGPLASRGRAIVTSPNRSSNQAARSGRPGRSRSVIRRVPANGHCRAIVVRVPPSIRLRSW
jgi:hypothetical protein